MKVTNIPVIVGALGFIKKGMEDNIKKIPGKTKIEQIQKTAYAHILRKALSM
jgi:hypothetical protein